MRELTSHKGGVLNDALTIEVPGAPTDAGDCRWYYVSTQRPDGSMKKIDTILKFHAGNPADGINGISNEALLAIVEDRLAGFQAGPFACVENNQALLSVRVALACLKMRTAERRARGVEGQATP